MHVSLGDFWESAAPPTWACVCPWCVMLCTLALAKTNEKTVLYQNIMMMSDPVSEILIVLRG